MPNLGSIFRWSDGLLVGWVLLALAISVAIAFSGLEQEAQWPAFVKLMMTLVPSIEPWARYSRYPNHIAIFFATLWALSPLLLYVMVVQRERCFPLTKFGEERVGRMALVAIIMAVAFLAVTVFGLGSSPESMSEPSSPRSLERGVLSSRLNAALLGSMVVFFTCYCVVAAGVFLNRVVKRKFT